VKSALVAGLLLTAMATTVLHLAFGHAAMLPAAVFGLLSTAIQVAASRARGRAESGGFDRSAQAFAAEMGVTSRSIGCVASPCVTGTLRRNTRTPFSRAS
jgi:hypothetical protein